MKSPYKVLWVEKSASDIEIKKAYLDKAKKHHPDIWWTKEIMQEINRAYENIMDLRNKSKKDASNIDYNEIISYINKSNSFYKKIIYGENRDKFEKEYWDNLIYLLTHNINDELITIIIESLLLFHNSPDLIYKALLNVDNYEHKKILIDNLCKYDYADKYIYKALEYIKDIDLQKILIDDLCEYRFADKYIYKALKHVQDINLQEILIDDLCEYKNADKYVALAFEFVHNINLQIKLANELKRYRNARWSVLTALSYATNSEIREMLFNDFNSYESISNKILKRALTIVHEEKYIKIINERMQ